MSNEGLILGSPRPPEEIPAPEGYIDLRSAINAYVKEVLGGWTPDSYVKVRLKKKEAWQIGVRARKTVWRLDGGAGSKQNETAIEWLRDEFTAGWLIAVAVVSTTREKYGLPARFWKDGAWARDTLHTGHVAQVHDLHDWQGMVGQPVFIERSAFEDRLSEITGRQTSKPAAAYLEEDVDAAYLARVEDTIEKTGQPPTKKEDEQWAMSKGLGRDRGRELRKKHGTAANRSKR